MNDDVEEELPRRPKRHGLCGVMRHGLLKLHETGREAESLRTEDSITTTMVSWPYYIWMEIRSSSAVMTNETDMFHQDFILTIKTVNEHAKMALENVPFEDCPRCSKRYAGKLCIFQSIPPQEFIRCFCIAHPDVRSSDCPSRPGPGNSECPSHCTCWELAKGEMKSLRSSIEKRNLETVGPHESVYSCMAEIVFRQRKPPLLA